MNRTIRTLLLAAGALGAASGAAAQEAPQPGDTVYLSLESAAARATGESEEVRLARSQLSLARAQVSATRAQALPQISANLGYTRTFESSFSSGGSVAVPDSMRFEPDPSATLEERVRYLEDRVPTAALGGFGSLFSDLPFGQDNTYNAGITGTQILYSGGRVGAALNIARHYRSAADLGLAEEVAEIELQVRTAYYQALLAQEFQDNAVEALAQAERFLEQERLRQRAGRASELEVMRAEVSRDNLRPQLVEAQNAADLAFLNLKRLIDLPLTQPLRLTTELAPPAASDTTAAPAFEAARRAAILAAEEQVAIREQQVRIAKGAFLPSVQLQMNYGRQLFPSDPFDLSGQWRTDWAATVGVSIPLFSGGQRVAEVERAEVELDQARLQLSQLRESVQLQFEQARGERARARAAIEARERTAEVAQRVYELTVLRYEQGLATQLEVSDARLSLLQARTNLAQAIADYHIADAGVARAQADAGTAARAADAVER